MQSQLRLHGFAACAIRGPDRPVRRPRKDDVHASACHVVSYDARLHCSLLPYKTTCKAQRVCMGLRRVRYVARTGQFADLAKMTCTHPLATSFRRMQDYIVHFCHPLDARLHCTLLQYIMMCKVNRVCMRLRRVRYGAPTGQFANLANMTCTHRLVTSFCRMQDYIVHHCHTKQHAKPSAFAWVCGVCDTGPRPASSPTSQR